MRTRDTREARRRRRRVERGRAPWSASRRARTPASRSGVQASAPASGHGAPQQRTPNPSRRGLLDLGNVVGGAVTLDTLGLARPQLFGDLSVLQMDVLCHKALGPVVALEAERVFEGVRHLERQVIRAGVVF